MRIPIIRGLIDRRILVNYRVDPDVLAEMLPAPFRPKLVHGHGLAGICLIRLKQLRPRFLPAFVGLSSENAAHRIAVEWEQDGRTHEGVYIPRRDTSSRLNTILGGRLFPGVHHRARFRSDETENSYKLAIDSDDGRLHVALRVTVCESLPQTSVFHSINDASQLVRCGSIGYSPANNNKTLEGLELRALDWNMTPLAVECVESSFFEDRKKFPAGAVEFDSAFLMRNIAHEWHEVRHLENGIRTRTERSLPSIAAAWRSTSVPPV